MITTITKEQEDKISIYLNKWMNCGKRTTSIDKEAAEKAINFVYTEILGISKPKHIVLLDSPYEVQSAINLIKNRKTGYEGFSISSLWYYYGIPYYGYYDYILNVLFPEKKDEFQLFTKYCEVLKDIHYATLYPEVAFVSNFPKEIHTNVNGDLHNENGPSISYRDGFSLYDLNGMTMPQKLIETPKDKLDAKEWLKEENVDWRREAFKKIGLDKVIKDIGAETIDTFKCDVGGKYELLMADIGLTTKRTFLKMQNPSIKDMTHIEGVEGKTAEEAVYLFRNDLTESIPPITMDGKGIWKKVTKKSYGQTGDLLYFPVGFEYCKNPVVKSIPKEAKNVKGNTIHLGNTGNHHGIKGGVFAIFDHNGVRFLDIKKAAILTHEEHKDTKIPVGRYEVRHVVEKDHINDLVRPVID